MSHFAQDDSFWGMGRTGKTAKTTADPLRDDKQRMSSGKGDGMSWKGMVSRKGMMPRKGVVYEWLLGNV